MDFPLLSSAAQRFTFDVFDTSICRLLDSPDHIHLIVARKLRRGGIIDLTAGEWHYARVTAEFDERLTVPHREITLEQVFERLGGMLDLKPDAARVAMQTELSEERRLARPITSVRRRVKELIDDNAPVLFVTDTYLPTAQVAELLEAAGYERPFDIVTSCERRLSKIKGTIYDDIAVQQGVPGSAFEHLGDNELSDVANARAHGWNATAFRDSHRTARERVLAASGDGGYLASAIAGSARAARLGQPGPVRPGVDTAAASVVGPLLAAYVLWVVRDVAARGGGTVHFLARDGQLMAQMAQRIADWWGLDIDARYVLGSRQAFLLPALPTDEDTRLLDEALGLAFYDRTSIWAALTALRFPPEAVSDILQQCGLAPATTRLDITADALARLREVLRRPDLLDSLRERATAARAATSAYLDSEGFFASEEANIVDLGWRGTTQLRLERVVGDRVSVVGYYLGLTNTVLGPESRTRAWPPGASLTIKTALLETMAAADHTSVEGFALDAEGEPVPVPALAEDSALVDWGVREQQAIALRFVDYLTAAVEPDHHCVDEVAAALQTAAAAAYRHFSLSPTPAEAEAYGGIAHADDVNHVNYRVVAATVSSLDVARHLFSRAARGRVTSWYMGSLVRSADHVVPRLISRSVHEALLLRTRLVARQRRRAARRIAAVSLGVRPSASRL